MTTKLFGMLLTDEGLRELEPALKDYWSEGPIGKYLYCREANPDRNYFHVAVQRSNDDGTTFEADVFIPHRFIKIVISGVDRKHIGFL